MTEILILNEPFLEFRYGQKVQDPHDGLTLFGPYDADLPSHPSSILYGAIGTATGIDALSKWFNTMNKPILPDSEQNARLWPYYPGFSAAFNADIKKPVSTFPLDAKVLQEASRQYDPNKRTFEVVNIYLNSLKAARKKDESFSCMICVVPDIVWKNCRPKSMIIDGIGKKISAKEKKLRSQGLLDFFELYEPEQYKLSVDFRRQFKARAMEYGIPIQIIRESTLLDGAISELESRGLTCPSDRAWNLSTAIYYKSGGKPWRLSSAREGVCYIGIAFRRQDMVSNTACCAAQMFLDSGDGIVFLGEYGPWYSEREHQCHLDKGAAKKLLEGVLSTYQEREGKKLNEIFLHCRSTINEDEFAGYKDACPSDVKLVGIRVRQERNGLKLFREGAWPVLRGTFLKLNERSGYLWASGFKDRLGTYDGWDIPIPLRIDIQYGDSDITQVAKDILNLSKLNYNACKLGDSEPVTIGFSDAVGEILISNPTIKNRLPNFKFYI